MPESKVRGFLSEVSSRTADDKAGCDKPGIHVRDNERVSNVHTNCPNVVAHDKAWNCKTLCVFLVLELSSGQCLDCQVLTCCFFQLFI